MNTEINTKNEQLQNELNTIKKKYQQLIEDAKPKKSDKNKKNKNNGSMENDEAEEDEKNNNIEDDDDNGTNRNLYLSRIQDRDFTSPEERKLKRERLKNLFKNKVFEMRDYLHRHFMKFYFNGIFIEMKRKAEDKPAKVVKSSRFNNLLNKFNNSNNSNNPNNNNNTKPVNKKINRLRSLNLSNKVDDENEFPFQKKMTSIEEININDDM